MVYVGIIGGSGLYSLIENPRSIDVETPFGKPSGMVEVGNINGVPVAFIPRHGKKHSIPPHKVNYRANIWALNSLGVKRIIAINAVGSLKEELAPGYIVIPDQFVDFTRRRELTFYDGPEVYHISAADPFCPDMNSKIYGLAKKASPNTRLGGSYVTVEGPRFSTRAESKMFRQFSDIIGMTLVPEVNLADEMSMCYSVIATITDYDVWSDKPVEAAEVFKIMKENESKVTQIVKDVLPLINQERQCHCKDRLKDAKA
ncbi:MAG: S-methyl-5'-thioadenosine phosphorylase [Candidatus Thermoplasmatota archaeon]|nr:S-methyl-5'-thioadenosine phosphorylase [Candidatus Thermoplasmatota archaeon]MCL6090372.1 S-methyl-5'-thioadenosine phosphorylase [Candidatus Thermoplasmatota archaeon]MDA8142526.1 S-methyl-5'-thioadenosine phosphorylase [Thermoplasmatales archaeon]